MHIVLASTAHERGGTWRHIEDVGVELRTRGHRVTVGLLPAARELQTAAASAGLAWRPLPRLLGCAADAWHLHLHDTFGPASLGVLALRRPFGPAIVTEHLPRTPGSDDGLAPGTRRRPASIARTAFKLTQLSLTARIIVPSHGTARFMQRRYGLRRDEVVVAHNGVASWPDSVPAFAGQGLQVVTLGALIEQKGHDVLLAAAARSRHPWTVTIVGTGPLRAELDRMAAAVASGRVRFVGWTDEPAHYLRQSDVLCMPSRYESFGYAAVEAAAWGRSAVASRVDGLEEIIVPDHTGILVQPGDPAELAAALDSLWEDRERVAALGRAARQRAREHFTIRHSVDALLSVYRDVGAHS
ncbi:MAG: glycosyltransferase family 4 protein [Actinomycetota bacterium]|nr:glycosyltransferase family 4 protein [Actinomycetota bacterium]